MSKNNIKEAALKILSKGVTVEVASDGFSKEELFELEFLIKSINKKTGDGRYGTPNPDVNVKELLKTDKNGQWSLEKAIKPGPTLDYSKFNKKPDYAAIEAAAPTINYGNNSPKTKPTWTGAADKTAATRAKIDAEANETAVDTFKRRGQVAKEEGVNLEPELTSEKMKRMVAKNEMMGYGPQGSPEAAGVMQSEKEPHKDDPHHEEKEKKKAKKIKDEADSLLDMHKTDKEILNKGSVHKLEHPMVQHAEKIAKNLGAKVGVNHISPSAPEEKHHIEVYHQGEISPAHEKLHAALSGHLKLNHKYSDSSEGEHRSIYEIR